MLPVPLQQAWQRGLHLELARQATPIGLVLCFHLVLGCGQAGATDGRAGGRAAVSGGGAPTQLTGALPLRDASAQRTSA